MLGVGLVACLMSLSPEVVSSETITLAIPTKTFQNVVYPIALEQGYMKDEGIRERGKIDCQQKRDARGYLPENAEAGRTERGDSRSHRLQRRTDQGFPGKGNNLISTRAGVPPPRRIPPSSLPA